MPLPRNGLIPFEGLFRNQGSLQIRNGEYPQSHFLYQRKSQRNSILSVIYWPIFLKLPIRFIIRASKIKCRTGCTLILMQVNLPDLIEKGRHKTFNHSLPRIIRPDLIWTEDGFAITELDSIPGGIGLTAWLNQTYSDFRL